jgi:hypothetical protein
MNKYTIFSIGVIGFVGYLLYKIANPKDDSKLFTLKKQTKTTTSSTTSTTTPSEDDLLIAEIEKYKVLLEQGKFPAALWNNPKIEFTQSSDVTVDEWFILNRKTKKVLYTMYR